MTLNIRDLGHSVQFSATALQPNPKNLLGLNECYKRLKQLGWVCANEIHPTARVSLFRLGGAAIWYDRALGWQVDVAGGILTRDGDLKGITVEAVKFDLLARCDPKPAKFTDHALSVGQQKAAAAERLGVKADYLNRKAPRRSEFRGIGHR